MARIYTAIARKHIAELLTQIAEICIDQNCDCYAQETEDLRKQLIDNYVVALVQFKDMRDDYLVMASQEEQALFLLFCAEMVRSNSFPEY